MVQDQENVDIGMYMDVDGDPDQEEDQQETPTPSTTVRGSRSQGTPAAGPSSPGKAKGNERLDLESRPNLTHPFFAPGPGPGQPVASMDPFHYPRALEAQPPPSQSPRRGRSAQSKSQQSENDTATTDPRSKSPVKTVAALQDVGGGIFYQPLSEAATELGTETGGKTLFDDLLDISRTFSVVPAAVQAELGAQLRPAQLDREVDMSSKHSGWHAKKMLAELESVKEVCYASRLCAALGEGEAEWNNAVHSEMLRLALRRINPGLGPDGDVPRKIAFRYVYVCPSVYLSICLFSSFHKRCILILLRLLDKQHQCQNRPSIPAHQLVRTHDIQDG